MVGLAVSLWIASHASALLVFRHSQLFSWINPRSRVRLASRCLAHACRSAPLAVALLVAFTTAVGARVDLSVASIEITQAIQTIPPSLTFVALRNTTVRVTIGVDGIGHDVDDVTGTLHVFVDGVEITPGAGVLPINSPMTAPLDPDREHEDDTLNFELLVSSTPIDASTDVDFTVEIDPVPGEGTTDNNSGSLDDLTFAGRCEPTIYFTRIAFLPGGTGLPDLSEIMPSVGDAFVRGIYPFSDPTNPSFIPYFYQMGTFPVVNWNHDPNGNGIVDAASTEEGSVLLGALEMLRQLIVAYEGSANGVHVAPASAVDSEVESNQGRIEAIGATSEKFLYGWINDNPIEGNGQGKKPGFVGYGNTEHIRYQRTFAHELGHQFGLDHNTRSIEEVGWDTNARLENNPATNNVVGRVKTSSKLDIMVAGLTSDVAWVDPETYAYFLASDLVDCEPIPVDRDVAVIRGTFNSAGTQLLRFSPVFQFPWLSEPTPLSQVGPFAARVTDSQDQTQVIRFNALVTDCRVGGSSLNGFFSVMARVEPGRDLARVRITDASGQMIYGQLLASQPPSIQVLVPSPGDSLGPSTVVQWSASDPDTPPVQRMFQVAYSPNNGETWVPVAVEVPGTQSSIIFNSREIERANGTGMIQVFMSDGLNTRAAQVGGLTTLNAQYPIGIPDNASPALRPPLRVSPNPFAGETRIAFYMSRRQQVQIRVYDVAGRHIRTILDGPLATGPHTVSWNGRDTLGRTVPAGVYVIEVRSTEATWTTRVTRLR